METDPQHISEADVPTDVYESVSPLVTPDNPPWSSWAALGVWAVSVLMIVFVPAIALMPYLISSGVFAGGNEQLAQFAVTDPTAVLIQIAAVIPAHAVTIAFSWAVITRFNQYSFREMVGWTSGGVRWWHYALILAGFFSFAAVFGSLFPEAENDLIRILRSSRTAVYVVAFMATFTAPVVEEVVYRGMLYPALQRSLGVPAAVVFVTSIFTLVHVPQYFESPSTIFLLTILSLILTLIRVYSGNLLPCVIFHTLVNGVQSLVLIFYPYEIKNAAEQAAAFIS